MKEAKCSLHSQVINYLKLGIAGGIGNEPNIPNALVTEAMAACMGATAAPAPGTALNKPNTVFKVAKTGVNNVIITIGDIVVSF